MPPCDYKRQAAVGVEGGQREGGPHPANHACMCPCPAHTPHPTLPTMHVRVHLHRYPPLMRSPAPGRKPRPRALRHLAREELGLTIQDGSHSPVDDARAALYIYHKHRREWERDLASGALARTAAQKRGLRKAVRDTLRDGAINAGAARRARLGRCKGQVKAAAALAAKARCGGAADAYTRDARDDPAADL
eukprot:93476-Chlamydomonas_euryale.AAC.4